MLEHTCLYVMPDELGPSPTPLAAPLAAAALQLVLAAGSCFTGGGAVATAMLPSDSYNANVAQSRRSTASQATLDAKQSNKLIWKAAISSRH